VHNPELIAGLKKQLAQAIRMLEKTGIIDFNGHFSVRVPGTDHVLINSGKSARNALTADDIVMIDLEGKRAEGTDAPPMEYHIHTEIYKRRSDVGAIVHSHPRWSTFFSMTGTVLKPVIPQGALLGHLGSYPQILSVNTAESGRSLAEALGADQVILLKSHGAVAVGADILEAFVLSIYLEENASRQYHAQALGEPYFLNDEEIRQCVLNLKKPHLFQKVWDFYEAKISM
jgi:ribulose-5-phosphate 4-epimerase/fuculose-1-phosphate aldolase